MDINIRKMTEEAIICGGSYSIETENLDLSRKDLKDEDIKEIAKLSNLKTLFLFKNQISDISPLEYLYNLENLDLSDNQLRDISPMEDLAKSQRLYLQVNNKISSHKTSDYQSGDMPAKYLSKLQKLYFSNNRISNIYPLKELFNLNLLYLDNNLISFIEPLINLQNLYMLDLSYNRDIFDIHVLQYLSELTLVNLKGCYKIKDFSPLDKNPSIKRYIMPNGRDVIKKQPH